MRNKAIHKVTELRPGLWEYRRSLIIRDYFGRDEVYAVIRSGLEDSWDTHDADYLDSLEEAIDEIDDLERRIAKLEAEVRK